MTSIANTARVALAVAVLALATAGAASADAFHPDPYLQRGAPADAFHPDPFLSRGVAPAGSSWSGPAALGASDYARPSLEWQTALIARFHLTGSGCYPRCMI